MSESTTPISPYPEWDDLYDEVDPVPLIVELMQQGATPAASLDVSVQAGGLGQLIANARERYVVEYWDWLCRSMPEGSEWRPHKSERRNWRGADETRHDYSAYREHAEPWRDFFDAHFGKKISATGNRARNPGRFRNDRRYPPLSKPALASIYHQLNRWWRSSLGTPFRPNFDGLLSADTDHARVPHLNPSARLFLLVAQAVDLRFNGDDCARVHDEEARRQNTAK